MEQGSNLDWEVLEEPASHHVEEVKEHLADQFRVLITYFQDYIFSIAIIKEAILQVKTFISPTGDYFDYSAEWQDVLEVFEHQLAKNF